MDTQYIQIIYIGTGIAVNTIGNLGLSSTEPPLESVLLSWLFCFCFNIYFILHDLNSIYKYIANIHI